MVTKLESKVLISVLMSVYSKTDSSQLDEALQSVIHQTYPPAEVLLVKDGVISSECEEVIDDWERRQQGLFNIITLKNNMGLGEALRRGVLETRHEIVARMDSDDLSDQRRFERQIEFLKQNKDISVVGSWIQETGEDPSGQMTKRKVPITHEEIVRYSRFRNPMNHITVMAKKSEILKAGNYQHFTQFEDYYLWIRMIQNGSKFANIPEALATVRAGRRMLSSRQGAKYFLLEISFQKKLWFLNYITGFVFLRNIALRSLPRLLPLPLVKFIYMKLAR